MYACMHVALILSKIINICFVNIEANWHQFMIMAGHVRYHCQAWMQFIVADLEACSSVIFQVDEKEKELQKRLPQIWDELILKSKNIGASLLKVKLKFTEVIFCSEKILLHGFIKLPTLMIHLYLSCIFSSCFCIKHTCQHSVT